MFAQRIKIPVCTDLNKNFFKTVEILFYNFVVHVLWNKLKTQWNLHFPSNNGKTLVCDKRDRAINCEFVVNLTLMFSGLLKKDLFDGNWRLAESFFKQNLSHKVCRLLSSSVLLHITNTLSLISARNNRKGRNKVYGIRDQQQKNGVGSGITAPGSGITSHGIRISGTVKGSGIQFSDITTKTAQFWNAS